LQNLSDRHNPFPEANFSASDCGAEVFCFDAFSSREPAPTSLENAPVADRSLLQAHDSRALPDRESGKA
jgi:hypothetical protein